MKKPKLVTIDQAITEINRSWNGHKTYKRKTLYNNISLGVLRNENPTKRPVLLSLDQVLSKMGYRKGA